MSKKIKIMLLTFLAAIFTTGSAYSDEREPYLAGKIVMYIPNRIVDAIDIVRLGLAVGPGLGVEVAATEYLQLGFYLANEKGFDLKGFRDGKTHSGYYWTTAFGPWRLESTKDSDKRFRRTPWSIRAQGSAAIVHLLAAVDLAEAADFITGFFLWDLMKDDLDILPRSTDKNYESFGGNSPVHKLGRGASNLFTGVWEIPKNMMEVQEEQGPVASATYGFFRGIGRFVTREFVGVFEIVTSPFGGKPIILPEYPFAPVLEDSWEIVW